METLRTCEQASKSLADRNETHIFFALDKKTHAVRVVGDEASVEFFTNQKTDLLDQVKKTLITIQSKQIEGHQGEGSDQQ